MSKASYERGAKAKSEGEAPKLEEYHPLAETLLMPGEDKESVEARNEDYKRAYEATPGPDKNADKK